MTTTSLPVAAFTTTAMDDATAYLPTKTYWQQKAAMGNSAPWWNGVSEARLATINSKLHPGAIQYSQEAGVSLTDSQM